MKDLSSEIFFRTARSGGKGGQNVNKVETMAEAWWHVPGSHMLTPDEKELVLGKLKNRINKDGYLLVRCSETRSQLENKLLARQKLEEMVAQSIVKQKPRKPTKPGKGAIERRLDAKKKEGLKKELRRKDW